MKPKFRVGQWVYDGHLRTQKIKRITSVDGIFCYEFFDTGLNQPEHHLSAAQPWRAQRMEKLFRDERIRMRRPPVIAGHAVNKLRFKRAGALIGEWWFEQGRFFRFW